MAITVVGTAEGSNQNGLALTITLPTVLQDDIVYVFTGTGNEGTAAPGLNTSGYTELFNLDDTSAGLRCFRKVMGASPDTTVQVTAQFNGIPRAAVVVAVRGADTSTPEDATSTTAGQTTSTNPDSPSITTVTNGALVISAFATSANDSTVTAPSGYTDQVDDNENNAGDSTSVTVGAASKIIASAGAENPASWTNVSNGSWFAASVAVRPFVSSGASPTFWGTVMSAAPIMLSMSTIGESLWPFAKS